eukprot:scaffold11351_cov36-Phaeocystis_antarctica.AAC.1
MGVGAGCTQVSPSRSGSSSWLTLGSAACTACGVRVCGVRCEAMVAGLLEAEGVQRVADSGGSTLPPRCLPGRHL